MYKQVLCHTSGRVVLLVVVNKHNTARVEFCWFIIYYRLMMHGNSNIKKTVCLQSVNNKGHLT